MNIIGIEKNVKQLITNITNGKVDKKNFIYEFLLAYGHRPQSVRRLRSGERNLSEDKENSVFWKRQLYFKISNQQDLHDLIDKMIKEKKTKTNKIRFIIVTDFNTFLAIDTKTQDTLDISFNNLFKKFDFFLPWAGMEKAVYQGENPADVKAAEKLAKLFDEIKADNFNEDLNNKEQLHQFNLFLSRLLFCYFAEDTEIFREKQFSDAIDSHTKEDGSDLSDYLKRLFSILNQPEEQRPKDLPDYLSNFPYVNGGLFKDNIHIPEFTRKSRKILIECGAELDWSDINPDIFGSMFQAVVHTEQRSSMGQHYTSVPNIMKVIEPLFLNDLYEELEKNQGSINKLLQLQQRLCKLKIFDPACGSGNFLIIAYKELRKFEIELLKRVQELDLKKTKVISQLFSVIQVSQFYGIEIDDFAHEVAILSLWLVEHQMNLIFRDELGKTLPTLPLKTSGNIFLENALLCNWLNIFDNENDNIYILGNPPYLGSKLQSKGQKQALSYSFENSGIKSTTLDYIYGWFYKASEFVNKYCNAQYAFVSTNSIFQGEQVETISYILSKFNLEIKFAYQSFKWRNNAKHNAGVTCTIVGITIAPNIKSKYIYYENNFVEVSNINSYLIDGKDLVISKRTTPLSKTFPKMNFGNMPNDNGFLLLNSEEKELLITQNKNISKYIKKTVGAAEFIRGQKRYCIWVTSKEYEHAKNIEELNTRFHKIANYRSVSSRPSTLNLASVPYRFGEVRHKDTDVIIIPRVSSENREYIPIGILSKDYIVLDSAMVIYDAEPWMFSLLSSKMHMAWVKTVGGRLKTDYRYSASIIYNNFPCPELIESNKQVLTKHTMNILACRENYSNKTLAELYDPQKMPDDLRTAHNLNDCFVDSLYTSKIVESDEQRLEVLFELYEKMIRSKG
ncbi:DNA methyltransferase [Snodgrassella sp.]|uniref:DNA methyltransferase n=1 Tax=Snodgrassella sp. TaxID=2815304 RepID=UPI00258BE399|nr:DNA methyltransferase [Snodgrassella sp.]MCO6517913.1 class I SAM-dependent DNA methyltransferase [Snodgrassella sp.]